MTWTHTSRGRALDLLNPVAADIDLNEIGRALGHQCRYNGCLTYFYSVAEHSVHMARYFLDLGDHESALQGQWKWLCNLQYQVLHALGRLLLHEDPIRV